ncbi:MAG: hypothetical protein K2J73_04615 [Oscillospiraceae bacterium]|nr:hypothetical protein [Oscillospiraceae bacterium]
MSNKFLAVTCRVIGVILAVIFVIASLDPITDSLKYRSLGLSGYYFGMFLGDLFLAFTALILFWSISNVLFDAEENRENIIRLLEQNRKILRALNCDEPVLNYSYPQQVMEKRVDGGWICPKCGRTVPDSQRTCVDCGYQK